MESRILKVYSIVLTIKNSPFMILPFFFVRSYCYFKDNTVKL